MTTPGKSAVLVGKGQPEETGEIDLDMLELQLASLALQRDNTSLVLRSRSSFLPAQNNDGNEQPTDLDEEQSDGDISLLLTIASGGIVGPENSSKKIESANACDSPVKNIPSAVTKPIIRTQWVRDSKDPSIARVFGAYSNFLETVFGNGITGLRFGGSTYIVLVNKSGRFQTISIQDAKKARIAEVGINYSDFLETTFGKGIKHVSFDDSTSMRLLTDTKIPIKEARFEDEKTLLIDGQTYNRGHKLGPYRNGWFLPQEDEYRNGIKYEGVLFVFDDDSHPSPTYALLRNKDDVVFKYLAYVELAIIRNKRSTRIGTHRFLEYDLLIPQFR